MTTPFNILVKGLSLILLTGMTLVVMLILAWRYVPGDLIPIVYVVLGMLSMAGLTAVQRYTESNERNSRQGKRPNLTLDETVLVGLKGFGDASQKNPQTDSIPIKPWELNAGQLVGVDNELALAKLRMDVEREVRRLAYEANIDLLNRPVNIRNLAQELQTRQVLPIVLVNIIDDVVSVCNQAIHGQSIAAEDAANVVKIGGQLLEELRTHTSEVPAPAP